MSNRRHSSSSQQQTGDLASRNVYMKARRKVTPYAIPLHHQRSNLQEQDQRHINMEGESRPLEKKLEGKKQDGTSGSWFKVTVNSFGIKYDEKWLMNLIQSHCSIPFTPVEFHYEKMQAHFFVVDASIAYELKSINDKILDDNNDKISIFVSPSDAPHSVQKELTSEKAEKIMLTQHKLCSHNQLTMNKQYDASQQILDRQILPFDRGCTVPSLNIHEENMTKHLSSNPSQYKPYELFGLPDTMLVASNIEILDVYKNEVESEGEMIKRKELGPGQICADRSSLHTTMPDKSRNINSILELFPKLLCLDGQGSLKPTICDTETCKTLPTGKGSFFGSEMLKNLVLQFLQQYYMIYDYGDRQSLLSTYHDEACFSLTVNFSSIESSLSSLCEYYKYSRNIKTLSDSYVRRQLLKHKKHNIVDSLCALPKTQHDFTSFIVDMCFQTETMLCFSVNGVFKELEGRSHGYIRAFNRTFITTISSSSSLCIINDKLFIKDAQRTSSAFISIDTPSPSSSYVPTLSLEHQGLVQSFYIQSRTDLHRSQKCPHDNYWDYNKAIQNLDLLKARKKI